MAKAKTPLTPELIYERIVNRPMGHLEMVLAVADLDEEDALHGALEGLQRAIKNAEPFALRNGVMFAAACCDRLLGLEPDSELLQA